jgi:hypothetical protein
MGTTAQNGRANSRIRWTTSPGAQRPRQEIQDAGRSVSANCRCYRLAGDRDSAIANYQKAREILPENEIVLQDLGW